MPIQVRPIWIQKQQVLDFDGDGYGDMDPLSYYDIIAGTDCDDEDASTFLGAAEIDDPDGLYCLTDADEDGLGLIVDEVLVSMVRRCARSNHHNNHN